MDDLEKKKYNHQNYLKNREKIINRSKNRYHLGAKRPSNVIPIFKPLVTDSVKPAWSRLTQLATGRKVTLERIFILILVGAMSGFLITESARFYRTFDIGLGHASYPCEAWFKAVILEGALVFFSWAKARNRTLALGYRLMTGIIFAYGLWVMSGSVLQASLQGIHDIELKQTQILDAESVIQRKEAARDHFLKTDRIGMLRQYDRGVDVNRHALSEFRLDLNQLKSPVVIWNTMATLIIFRLIVLITNVLCLNYLSRRDAV